MKNSIFKRIFVILLSGIIAFSAYGSMPISTISVSAAETSLSNMPAAITGLKFTSQTNSITLSWNMSEDASGYYVYVKSSKEPYNFFKYATIEDGKITSWTGENLTAGKIYEFRVQPYKIVDSKIYKGDYEEIATITTPATVRKILASDITDTSITLNWGAVTNADGYYIYRRLDSEYEPKLIKTIDDQQTIQWTDTELDSESICEYDIKAYKEFNGEKIFSDDVWLFTATNPSGVTNLKVSSRTTNTITLNWSSSKGAIIYDIYQESSKTPGTFVKVGTVDSYTTSYVREGLSSGTEYTFRVQPIKSHQDKMYKGKYEEIKTITLPASVRKVLTSEITETSITINWGAVTGATGYCIDRKLTTEKKYTRVKVIANQSVTKWTDKNLQAGKDYYYVVRPYKKYDGKVFYGKYIKISASTLPSATKGLKTNARTSTAIKLTWSLSEGATSYDIYQESAKTPGTFVKIASTANGQTKSCVIRELASGRDYTFRVQPIKKVGDKIYKGQYKEIATTTLPASVRRVITSNTSKTSTTLTWGAVSGADGYVIDRKFTTVVDYDRVKVIEGQDITQWTDTELEAGKDYYYVVRAFKRFNGTILYGNYIKISASTLPEDVTGLKLSSLTTDAIKLVWNTSSGATDYDIYQESSKTPGTFVKIENISANSYVIRGLAAGKNYTFRIQPIKTVGNKRYKGAYQEIAVGTRPATVRTVATGEQTSNSILVKWGTVSGADGYVIVRKLKDETAYKTMKVINKQETNEWTDTDLLAGSDCSYGVRAYKIIGGSKYYGSYIYKDGYTLPEAINSLKVIDYTSDSVKFKWESSAGADGYDIYRESTKTQNSYNRIASLKADATEYVDKGLSSGTVYNYKIDAYKLVGETKKYGEISYISGETITAAVKGLKVDENTTNSIKLAWHSSTGADGYIIYKKAEGETIYSEYNEIIYIHNYNQYNNYNYNYDNDGIIYWTDDNLESAKACSYRIVTYSYVDDVLRKSDVAEIDACTLPESVKNLKVISTGYSTLRLSWDKVANATGYLIYRQSTTDITKYGLIATVSNGAITSYTDSELPSASEFTYRVVAYREFNEKKYSGEYAESSNSTYPYRTSAIKTDTQSTSSITFFWNEVSRADGYKIYVAQADGGYKLLATLNSQSLKYSARGLASGTEYRFAVAAYKNYNNTTLIGEKVEHLSVTCPDVTTSFTSSSRQTGSLKLNWKSVSGADGYCIYKKNNNTGEIYVRKIVEGGSTVSYQDDGLYPGESQYYRIAAYKELSENKVLGDYTELTTYTIPMYVDGFRVENKTDKAIRVAWNQIEGISGYKVERKLSTDSSYKVIATVSGSNNLQFVDRNLTSGAKYNYRIRTYKNINGSTVYSAYKSITGSTFSQTDINNIKSEIIRLTNVERNKAGLKTLSVNSKGASGSAVRAKETATLFDHTRPNGTKFYTAFNFTCDYIGENIGCQPDMTAESIVNAWMNSSGHRANILNSHYTSISVGLYLDIDSDAVMYAVQNFFG